MSFKKEFSRRRTLAIVSHPDAGKTTLTEKLLLYGGAIHLAGSVTSRKNQRATTSDWMELERKRGISISSTVLNFDYQGYRINLLDTPGHKDFCEDTYRVLTAVDSAIMVIDAGKGIESQTLKLFEVCRMRGVPIFTFVNKMDRPTREPLELLEEIERVLGIQAFPMNWPLGTGFTFRGVWDRQSRAAYFYERAQSGAKRAPFSALGLDDPGIRERLNADDYTRLREELELLDSAGARFSAEEVLRGETTPVFFGSALNNFGVQLMLDGFVRYSAAPTGRASNGELVVPESGPFSAFVFKIQANMDPKHRDRVAFLRIVSGQFRRDMTAIHVPTGKSVRLSNSSKVFGQDRETVDEAYPGDVVGIVGANYLGIGDTLSEDPRITYDEIPRFPAECFAFLHNLEPSNHKRFRAGLEQLLQEGVVRSFELFGEQQRIPLLAAVGPLQFEIVQYRLESEYGATSRVEMAPWVKARWTRPLQTPVPETDLSGNTRWARDDAGRDVLLFTSDWHIDFFQRKNPHFELSEYPLQTLEAIA